MPPRVRGVKYTQQEDLAICRAYVFQTQDVAADVATGRNVSQSTFWEKVF